MEMQNITDALRINYMPYAMSVIISRAIPEIDGFKPSHRKLLYTMYKMGLLNGGRTKSANVVGQTMKLNPHGDMAIYETMVRLTPSNESLLHPYVDSKGNFGKVYSRDMAFAASRYTEVKLEGLCGELFKNIDKDTVDFVDNYDNTLKEPTLFPVTFPTILTNPNQGIAVGMASNIASFNLEEICDAEIAYLKDENADVAQYIKAPDFPTGGYLLYDEEQMRSILETGRGSFKLRAKYQYVKKENLIEILEIPYTTTSEAIVDKVVENIKAGKLKEVSDIRDETGLNGLKITLDLKRGTDPDTLMLKLFKMTPLEDSFSCNFNILINGSPEVLGVKGILSNWTAFRVQCLKRQTRYDISAKSEKLHLLNGLKKILLDIDKAVKIVRETEDDAEVIPNLMKGFSIDEKQAEFVAEIKLRNLNKKYILNKVEEVESLRQEIEALNKLLGDPKLLKKQIIEELTAIKKKHSKPRRTEILQTAEVEHFSEDAHIEDYNLKLYLTKQGYLKKIPLTSLRAGGEHKFKEGDKLLKEFDSTNLGELIVFTNQQNVYKLKVHELSDTKLSGMGDYLKSVLGCDQGEEIVDVFPANEYKGYFLFAYENGKMAKIPLSSYATKTNRKKLIHSYSDAAKLIKILYLAAETDLVAYSSVGKILVFHSSAINPKTTRNSNGVNVLTLRRGAALKRVAELERTRLKEPDYYRTKNIPAVGCFQKEDGGEKQLKMF